MRRLGSRIMFWLLNPLQEDPNKVCRDEVFRDISAVDGELAAHDPQKAPLCWIENARSRIARRRNVLDQRREPVLIARG